MNARDSETPRRRRNRPGAVWRGTLILGTLFGVSLVSVLLAQISSPRGRNLVVPEYFEHATPGARSSQLKGRLFLKEIVYLSNRRIYGKDMQLEQYTPDGITNLVARAPECVFSESNRTVTSTGLLMIAAMDGQFNIATKEGFEASLTNTVLTLSNRVRLNLKQNLLKP
jgi:hypothetical protein